MEKLEFTYEYLLVLSPDDQTSLIAASENDQLERLFNRSFSTKFKSHITVCNFLLFKQMEERLTSYFEIFAKSVKPFRVEINGFDHFETHTIFLNIISKEPIVRLMKDIRTRYRRFMMVDKGFPPFFPTSRPHMTVVRGLSPEQFELAWPEYEKKEFTAFFEVSEMVLLAREFLSQANYQVVRRITFAGTKDENIQLGLEF
jgi:2'-5' RNA ligase